jgi:hypothetical protein
VGWVVKDRLWNCFLWTVDCDTPGYLVYWIPGFLDSSIRKHNFNGLGSKEKIEKG